MIHNNNDGIDYEARDKDLQDLERDRGRFEDDSIDIATPDPEEKIENLILEIRLEGWMAGVYLDGKRVFSLYPSQCQKELLETLGFTVEESSASRTVEDVGSADEIIYMLNK